MIQFSFYLGSAGHRPFSVSCGLTCETLAISQLPPACSVWPIEDRVHPHIGLQIMSTRHCPCLCSPRGRTRRLSLLICPISARRRLFAPYSTVTIRFRPLRIDLLFICLFVEIVPLASAHSSFLHGSLCLRLHFSMLWIGRWLSSSPASAS